MKHAIIYRVCKENQPIPGEQPVKFEWSEQPPLSSPISMGIDFRWKVAKTVSFANPELDTTVHLVLVTFSDQPIPPQEEWISYQMQELCPQQSLLVTVDDQESLLIGQIYTPKYRESAGAFAYLGEFTASHEIGSIEEFYPAGDSPYKSAILCRCNPIVAAKDLVTTG